MKLMQLIISYKKKKKLMKSSNIKCSLSSIHLHNISIPFETGKRSLRSKMSLSQKMWRLFFRFMHPKKRCFTE
jgi:hypothetical protein